MGSYRIAAVPGDGIGAEVVGAGVQVLEALQRLDRELRLEFTSFDWGSDYYRAHGVMMPDDGLAQLRPFDAIYFGAVGDPRVPDHVTLWGLRLAICQGFDQYANVRPTRVLRGLRSPLRDLADGELDWVIVRENSEGEYAGQGGRAHRGHAIEVGTEVAVFTRQASSGSCASHSSSRARGRAASSPSSRSRTRSGTGWCCGTRSPRRSRAIFQTSRSTRCSSTR